MNQGLRNFLGRAGAIVTVVAIAILGNLRSQASEATGAGAPVLVSTAMRSGAPRGPDVPAAPGVDSDGLVVENDASANDDDGRLVPAIYAWDPDVRFVYYRHVSKWM